MTARAALGAALIATLGVLVAPQASASDAPTGVDPIVCPIFASLAGTYGAGPVAYFYIDATGDVWLYYRDPETIPPRWASEKEYDCPPYDPPPASLSAGG